jgi:hypothetical protein
MSSRCGKPSNSFCCLCGIRLTQGVKRRYQRAAECAAFVRKRCKASPFLYSFLVAQTGAEAIGVCIPCVNWKRRVETCGLRRMRLPMLQLDQLICFLLRPGQHMEPDRRCMGRLVLAARDPGNPYRCVFPAPVKAILERVEADTFVACVAAWWEYNGRTEFFASGQEARRVRGAVKAVVAL